jgi:hypothetical protein
VKGIEQYKAPGGFSLIKALYCNYKGKNFRLLAASNNPETSKIKDLNSAEIIVFLFEVTHSSLIFS